MAQPKRNPEVADRIAALADKANEGNLTAEEWTEYEAYIEANNLLAVLQSEVRLRLDQKRE